MMNLGEVIVFLHAQALFAIIYIFDSRLSIHQHKQASQQEILADH